MSNKDLTDLYERQICEFELAGKNFAALREVICRDLHCNGFRLRLQYNPARIVSTNARTDAESISKRKCFLCPDNMPAEQHGIEYGDNYRIFINPYPIFTPHFTVPSKTHSPQRIAGRFGDMLSIARDFPAYTVFYNGPASGASAPDHFHFQIVPQGQMPLEEDVNNSSLSERICTIQGIDINILNNYMREVIVMHSNSYDLLNQLFHTIQICIGQVIPFDDEPRFNLFAWYGNGKWTVCIMPRKQWRPYQFFEEGDAQIMFSPGCADMAGLIIAPRKQDFDRYTPELMNNLFSQVSINQQERDSILQLIQQSI